MTRDQFIQLLEYILSKAIADIRDQMDMGEYQNVTYLLTIIATTRALIIQLNNQGTPPGV